MKRQLADIASVIRGVTFDKNEALDLPVRGYLPILRAGNIGIDLVVDKDLVWVPESRIASEQRMQVGDIAICMSSGSPAVVGKSATLNAPWPGSVGAFCSIIRPQPNHVVPEYLSLFLQSEVFRRWTRQSSGANIKNIRKSELESFPVPVPSESEQRRIVDLLTLAEGIVRLRREAAAKAAELIPAIFIDMFGDPVKNPKHWPISPLGELVTLTSGGTPSKSRPDYWEGNLPWVSPKDMKRDLISGAIDHVHPKVLDETTLKLIPAGTVLIVVRGMILVHTVPVALTATPVVINQDMKALQLASELSSTYLLWLLKVSQPRLLELVSTAAHGTKKLETKDLLALNIPLPPMAQQRQFVERAQAIESILIQQANAIEKAQATFNALLAQAFAPHGGL